MVDVTVERRSQWVGRLSTDIKRAGFGIGEFAQRMGVNRTTIWRLNRGDFAPSRDWTARAETLLGLRDEPQAAA